MELVEQQRLPQARERLARIGLARERGEQLRVVQRALAAAVAALDLRLRRVGAAVQLEVELADDRAQVGRVGFEVVEELDGRAQRRARQPVDVARPGEPLEHPGRRPAAAVAVPEHHQRVVRAAVVLVDGALAVQLLDGRLGVVGVGGREVRQDLAAVQPLPGERVVFGLGEAVPGQLLRQEAGDAGLAHQLRELGGVAEDVGVPELRAVAAELAREEALAVEELTRERLAAREVAVGLDPRPADRDPAAGGDRLADALEQRRGAIAQPGVVLRLRVGEDVLGIVVEQPQLCGRGADQLAVGLLERPQPGGVEVGVADGGGEVQGARGPSEQPVQVGAVAVDRERVQLGQQLARPRGLRDRLQREQELQIVERAPGVRVDRRHVAAAQLEPHSQPLARRAEPERVVAGQLELEDPLAGRHRDRLRGPGAARSSATRRAHRPATPWPRRRSRDTGARARGRSRSPATSTWRTAARAAARARRAGTRRTFAPLDRAATARGRAEWDSRRREGARRTGRCVRARTRDGEALSAPDRTN